MKIPAYIEHKEGYQEKPKKTLNKAWIDKKVGQLNIDTPIRLSDKTINKSIVETNLRPEDFDDLSSIMGDEIASIVIDEIILQQSPKLLDTTREIA